MRRAAVFLAVLTGLVVAACLYWLKIMHALGWDGQTSDYYAAWSSSIPALIALGGYASLVASVLHRFNCHERGCLRVGRHHIGSGVWCSVHQGKARPQRTDSDRLDRIIELLERQERRARAPRRLRDLV